VHRQVINATRISYLRRDGVYRYSSRGRPCVTESGEFVERHSQGRTDAANRCLRVGVSQATFCTEGLVGSTECERVRNHMHTKVSTICKESWDFTPPSSPGEAEINAATLPEGKPLGRLIQSSAFLSNAV
jgi:hypothetical protein